MTGEEFLAKCKEYGIEDSDLDFDIYVTAFLRYRNKNVKKYTVEMFMAKRVRTYCKRLELPPIPTNASFDQQWNKNDSEA